MENNNDRELTPASPNDEVKQDIDIQSHQLEDEVQPEETAQEAAASVVEAVVTAVEDADPAVEETAAPVEDATPALEETASPVEDAALAVEETARATKTPGGDAKPPRKSFLDRARKTIEGRRAKPVKKAPTAPETSGDGEAEAKPVRPKPAKKSKEEKRQELEQRKAQLVHTTQELNGKLKQLLSGEIKAMNKRQKGRGAEILAVFAKHNFYANGFTPAEMRTTLEDLGPTYVKIGQIMSSRVDMLPESYCKELEKLRQNVKELDPQIARAVIEQETGKKIEEIYSEFRDKPLGSASIGQAHYGVLKDGTHVVTKVQRPLIAEMMREDFVLLKKLGAIVNSVSEAGDDEDQMIDLVSVIEELEKVTEEELDFRVEAENTRFFKENCIVDEAVVNCPTVIDELTTERIFTMTFVDGYSVAKRDRMIEEGYDPQEVGRLILDNYIHQVLDVGSFHADPHQGNIMFSKGVPYWIDFGMIGRITDADVNLIQSLILSMIERDVDSLVNTVMSMGATSPKTNRNKLVEDADAMLEKYMNVTSLDELDLSVLLEEVTDLAAKHHISLPGKYTMLVRSIATIEGVIEQLCPELNLFQLISDKLMDRMKKSFDVEQELVSAGKDVLELGKKVSRMPGLAYDALNNAVRGRLKLNFELTGYEDMLDKLSGMAINIVLALFACVLFFGSCILSTADIQPKTPNGQPLISAAGIVFSIALGIYTIRKMSKRK